MLYRVELKLDGIPYGSELFESVPMLPDVGDTLVLIDPAGKSQRSFKVVSRTFGIRNEEHRAVSAVVLNLEKVLGE